MAKLTFPKSVTPSCAKPFTCLPPSLGVGVSPSSLGSPFWKAASSMTSLSAAPSCASSSTSPSVCSNIKNLLTLCSSLLLKPFDFQDRIYRLSLRKPRRFLSGPENIVLLLSTPYVANWVRRTPAKHFAEVCALSPKNFSSRSGRDAARLAAFGDSARLPGVGSAGLCTEGFGEETG